MHRSVLAVVILLIGGLGASAESTDVTVREDGARFLIVFEEGPDSILGLDAVDRCMVVELPGKKGFRPRVERIEEIVYDGSAKRVSVTYTRSSGEQQTLRWNGLAPATWARFRAFAEEHFGATIELVGS